MEYVKQHVILYKHFLPNNFADKAGGKPFFLYFNTLFLGDNDCVSLCLLFPRFAAKSLLLVKLLNLKYPPVPNGIRREHITLCHKAEQWAHVKKFGYWLQSLYTILKKFEL